MKPIFKESRPLVGNVKTYVFTPKEKISWQPGQFIHYKLPHASADDRGEERWFTVASPPYQNEVWITTRFFEDKPSTFKKALNNLKPGDEIETGEPEGDFIADNPNQNYIFVAGGIGITPFHSILAQWDHDGQPINVELLYANRDENAIPFKDELEALSKKHPNFNITYFIGDNRIDEKALKEFGQKVDNPYYYVSGPEPMVEAFEKMLENIEVPKDRRKFDYFPGYQPE